MLGTMYLQVLATVLANWAPAMVHANARQHLRMQRTSAMLVHLSVPELYAHMTQGMLPISVILVNGVVKT